MNHHPWLNLIGAWVGLWIGHASEVIGNITLSQIVLVLTGIFTVLQIWKILREFFRERKRERDLDDIWGDG